MVVLNAVELLLLVARILHAVQATPTNRALETVWMVGVAQSLDYLQPIVVAMVVVKVVTIIIVVVVVIIVVVI